MCKLINMNSCLCYLFLVEGAVVGGYDLGGHGFVGETRYVDLTGFYKLSAVVCVADYLFGRLRVGVGIVGIDIYGSGASGFFKHRPCACYHGGAGAD